MFPNITFKTSDSGWNFFHSLVVDSPGVPPSANAHELFRGFSFIASCLLDDNMNSTSAGEGTAKSTSSSGSASSAATVRESKPTLGRFKSVSSVLK